MLSNMCDVRKVVAREQVVGQKEAVGHPGRPKDDQRTSSPVDKKGGGSKYPKKGFL